MVGTAGGGAGAGVDAGAKGVLAGCGGPMGLAVSVLGVATRLAMNTPTNTGSVRPSLGNEYPSIKSVKLGEVSE